MHCPSKEPSDPCTVSWKVPELSLLFLGKGRRCHYSCCRLFAGTAAYTGAVPHIRICNLYCVLGKHCFNGTCVPDSSGVPGPLPLDFGPLAPSAVKLSLLLCAQSDIQASSERFFPA